MANQNNSNPLGKEVAYIDQYDVSLLFPVARQQKRDELGLTGDLPFHGSDFWNGYELSWLNAKGKPQVAIGVFEFGHDSVNIVESKSFKLYLNSFNQTRFDNWQLVQDTLIQDLTNIAVGKVRVSLYELEQYQLEHSVTTLGCDTASVLLDVLDIAVDNYDYESSLLRLCPSAEPEAITTETLTSHLLKSNCLITSQPDWASVIIDYKGPQIEHESLLRYLISFRNHNEFHEQCVERIFTDIMTFCRPQELTVYARYTRRGGLDINPWRSNVKNKRLDNFRLVRQ